MFLICWGQGAQASTQDLNCLIQPFVVITITTPVGGLLGRCRLTVVDRVVDAASGTFGVRLELPNHDLKLPAGLKCSIRFGKGTA